LGATRSELRSRLRHVDPALAERYRAEGWWAGTTLGAVAEAGLAALHDEAFVVHSQVRPWRGTFGDVDARARALAGWLGARGVGAGDVVVLQLPNWMEAGVAFFAATYLGAVVVPVVHFYGAKEVGYILRATEPAVVVTPDCFGHTNHLALYDDLLGAHPDTCWLVACDPGAELPTRAVALASTYDDEPDHEPVVHAAAVDPGDPALIGFTSGTTRDPKGVVHSHDTILCETRQLDEMNSMPGPPGLTGAPVGHFIGMIGAFLLPLLRHEPVHLLDVWNPAEVLRIMREEQVGVLGGATYFLTSLLDHPDFSDEHRALMPYAGLGGAPIPAPVAERLDALGIVMFRSYGSTEHPSITGSGPAAPRAKRLYTDGCAMPGVELRLDEDGQILSRGPDLFLGYTDPELTAQVFDDDGWYHTGDVGVLDDDGYLAITDRISDVIIRGGENISAQEIEEQLLTLPGLAEVAVVAAPDARLGEHAAAVVRPLDGHAAPSLDDVRAHLEAMGLARQKWPEELHVVADLPRTASGKIQKFRLRQALREGTLA
jgi:acyl-CoA synthetase (AMP-forming)/AMP-acid ligase II